MAATLASIVAASGAADVTLKVQYQGPRGLPDLSACSESLEACPFKVEILDADDVFGYGYSGGYAYRFLEWLSQGNGYNSYSMEIEELGGTVNFHFSGLPVGRYVFRAYYDLTQDNDITEDFEPLAFAEEAPGDATFEITLGGAKSGLAVISEGEGILHGTVLLTDGRSPLGALVTAFGPFGDEYHAEVQPDGTFTLLVPTGLWYELPYTLLVTKEGYHAAGAEISLGPGTTTIEDPFQLVPIAIDVPLHLQEGWNLVSLPVHPENPAAAAIFGASPVFAYDATGYQIRENGDTLLAGEGYWVYADAAHTLTVRGVPHLPEPAELTIEGDRWHLVGGPAYEASIGPGATGIELPLYTWAHVQYAESSTLVPGVGYWLLASSPTPYVPLFEEAFE